MSVMESGHIDVLVDVGHETAKNNQPGVACSAYQSKAAFAQWLQGRRGFFSELLMRFIKLVSVITIISLFMVCAQEFYIVPSFVHTSMSLPIIATLYAILTLCFSRTYNSYLVGVYRISELVYSQGLTNLFSSGISYVFMCLLSLKILNPLPLITLLVLQTLWSLFWSYYANKIYIALYPPMKTAILYQSDEDLAKLHQIKYFTTKFNIQSYIRDLTESEELYQSIKGYTAIIMVGVPIELRNRVTEFGIKNNIRVYFAPQVGDIILSGAKHMEMFSIPIYRVRSASPTPEYALIKRGFDLFASLIGLLIASPIMLITALAIKLYDGGPVLYKQTRLTRNGREFKIWKFRSMRVDAEQDGIARMACEKDCRITPIGKTIRASRIDELPQLFNILIGQMSIVGPRPERPEIAAQYEKLIPAFPLRLQVKAGLTGCAQVYGRYNTEPLEKLQMDLMYINNMSILEDLRLIFATVKILFIKDSTQGVRSDQITAAQDISENHPKQVA